jgi:hypothetical protein
MYHSLINMVAQNRKPNFLLQGVLRALLQDSLQFPLGSNRNIVPVAEGMAILPRVA